MKKTRFRMPLVFRGIRKRLVKIRLAGPGSCYAREGEENGMHKLTRENVLEIRRRCAVETGASVARDFGVSFQAISLVKRRERWSWLNTPGS